MARAATLASACGTEPITSSVAGLMHSIVESVPSAVHSPSM